MKTNISLSWDHGPIYHHLWPLSKYLLKYQLFSIKLFFHQTTLTGYKFISKCLFLSIFWFPMRLSYFLKFLVAFNGYAKSFSTPTLPPPPNSPFPAAPQPTKNSDLLKSIFCFLPNNSKNTASIWWYWRLSINHNNNSNLVQNMSTGYSQI